MTTTEKKDVCEQFVGGALQNWDAKQMKNPQTNRTIRYFKDRFNGLADRCSLYNDCGAIRGLRNVNAFTCYLDSVLMVLLAVRNKFIDRYILDRDLTIHNTPPTVCATDPRQNLAGVRKVQDEIRRLAFLIRNGHHVPEPVRVCRNLLRHLKRHCRLRLGTTYAAFYQETQNSASDFLAFILNVFSFCEEFHTRLITENLFRRVATDTGFAFTTRTTHDNVSCVWVVPHEDLQTPRRFRSLLHHESDTILRPTQAYFRQQDVERKNPFLFYRRVSYWEKIPPFFVVELSRVDLVSRQFLTTRVVPNKVIQRRKLFGVIVHVGYSGPESQATTPIRGYQTPESISDVGAVGSGHYTACLLCGNEWFGYDDLRSRLHKIGSFRDLVATTPVATHGVLFFYSL